MITVNSIKINTDLDKILVDVSADAGQTITDVLVWTETTFKDYSKALSFSDLLSGADEDESIEIPVADFDLTTFTGMYFIEVQSSDESTTLAPATNHIKYHECLLSNSLSLDINDCEIVANNTCEDCTYNTFYINTLFNSLQTAVRIQLFEEAIKIAGELDVLCGCQDCIDYDDVTFENGMGFGVVDDEIVLV